MRGTKGKEIREIKRGERGRWDREDSRGEEVKGEMKIGQERWGDNGEREKENT